MKYWFDQCNYCYLKDSCENRLSFEKQLKESDVEIRCDKLIPEDILLEEDE